MNQKKNSSLSNTVIIAAMVAFVLLIFTVAIISVGGSNKKSKKPSQNSNQTTPTVEVKESTVDMTAIFLEANTDTKKITVQEVQTGNQFMFDYSGGTAVTDKYGQLMVASQIVKGQIVSVSYIPDTMRLQSMSIAQEIWENLGVTDVLINKEAQVIAYLGSNYSYSNATVIVSNGRVISMDDILSMDYLTIRGFGEHIYSIDVTRGHGYLKLTGEDQFVGGTIHVGMQFSTQITQDMILTVREGSHTIVLSNGKTEGNKLVEIERGKTTLCAVDEFGIEPVLEGTVFFKVEPAQATLYVDGKKTSFASAVSLIYGDHVIEVSLGGYVTYHGIVTVDSAMQTVTITLPENNGNTGNNDTPSDSDTNQNGSPSDSTSEDDSNHSTENVEDNSSESNGDNDSNSNDNNSSDNSGNNSSNNNNNRPNKKGTLTIQWTTGAEVYFNGEYMGVIKDGKLVLDKQIGDITVDLVVEGEDTVTYNITVEDDGEDAVFSFPE